MNRKNLLGLVGASLLAGCIYQSGPEAPTPGLIKNLASPNSSNATNNTNATNNQNATNNSNSTNGTNNTNSATNNTNNTTAHEACTPVRPMLADAMPRSNYAPFLSPLDDSLLISWVSGGDAATLHSRIVTKETVQLMPPLALPGLSSPYDIDVTALGSSQGAVGAVAWLTTSGTLELVRSRNLQEWGGAASKDFTSADSIAGVQIFWGVPNQTIELALTRDIGSHEVARVQIGPQDTEFPPSVFKSMTLPGPLYGELQMQPTSPQFDSFHVVADTTVNVPSGRRYTDVVFPESGMATVENCRDLPNPIDRFDILPGVGEILMVNRDEVTGDSLRWLDCKSDSQSLLAGTFEAISDFDATDRGPGEVAAAWIEDFGDTQAVYVGTGETNSELNAYAPLAVDIKVEKVRIVASRPTANTQGIFIVATGEDGIFVWALPGVDEEPMDIVETCVTE